MQFLNDLLPFFRELSPAKAAFFGTGFTWFMTALGASMVFFVKKVQRRFLDIMLGFTGGVMLAASFWSLLLPSVEYSKAMELSLPWLPATLGFVGGALFIFLLDKIMPHLHINFESSEKEGLKTGWHNSTLLLLAITLHNIPEGLAIGILFGSAAQGGGDPMLVSAIALSIGIGIQNFPEGVAVSMPLRRLGMSRFKSFWYGQLSAVVEPIAGVLGALAVFHVQALLPYALAFAAGAMIYVVVEEVIPETQRDKYTDVAVLGFIAGFALMMILDISLS